MEHSSGTYGLDCPHNLQEVIRACSKHLRACLLRSGFEVWEHLF